MRASPAIDRVDADAHTRDCTWAPPSVVVSYKIRSLTKEMPFWSAFGLWFEFAPVLARNVKNLKTDARSSKEEDDDDDGWRRFSPGDGLDETFVLVAMRRPRSLSWTIPDEDRALLNGVGADGSESPKSDDQFERILLMEIEI